MYSPFSNILHTSAVPSPAECQQIQELLRGPRQEITRLQRLIDETTQKRDELQHFVDAHTALLSSARRLPDDILSEIFLECLPPTGNPAVCADQSPLLVSHISSNWRRAALSTPRLWASTHIAVPDQRRLDRLTEQVSLWLSRSGAVPLSISLALSQTASWTPDGLCDISSLLSILLAESRRWRNIHFSVSNTASNFFIPQLTAADVPLLHSMSFHNDISYSTRTGTLVDVSHPPLSFLGTDSLRSLNTSVYSLDLHAPGAVSWYTLVHLKLETETHGGITYSSALHLLSQCHFLEYCVIPLHRRTARDSPLAASVAHFTLPYLTELRLEVLGHAYDQHTKFFSCISLPALRYFEFRANLSSLEQLKVEVARLPQAVFLAMLPEMTSLRKLHMTRELSSEQPVDGDTLIHTSELLARLTVPDSGDVVLPQLRQLDLGTFRNQPALQIVAFAQSRRVASRVGVAQLERFSGRLDRVSGSEVLEKLGDEVAEGLDISLRYTGITPPQYSPMEGIP